MYNDTYTKLTAFINVINIDVYRRILLNELSQCFCKKINNMSLLLIGDIFFTNKNQVLVFYLKIYPFESKCKVQLIY